MSKVLDLLRECDERAGCAILAIVPNVICTENVFRECWDVVDLLGDTRAYDDPDCTDETGFLLARCYSVSELKEFLRNYERDEP